MHGMRIVTQHYIINKNVLGKEGIKVVCDDDWGSHIKDPILLFSLVGEKRVGVTARVQRLRN